MRACLPIIAAVVSAALLPSCGMKKMATNVLGKVATEGIVAVEGEEDIAFAREAAPALIKTLEVFRQGNPRDVRSNVLLAQSYGQFAFGFLEEDMMRHPAGSSEFSAARSRADLFYHRGKEFGVAALSARGLGKALAAPIPDFKRAVSRLGRKDVPALFWTAFNWANSLNLHLDDPAAIADLPRIEAMIDRVLAVDPDFYFGSAHAFKGVIASMRPKMLGGDPELAEREFKAAMLSSPNYLMTKVLYAQYYARQALDQALFRSTLGEVAGADAAEPRDARLANGLAKRRAQLLLGMQKKLF